MQKFSKLHQSFKDITKTSSNTLLTKHLFSPDSGVDGLNQVLAAGVDDWLLTAF